MPNTITVHRLAEAHKAADQCVHFGFCTAVCPTYVLDNEENDSPRGRIALAKDMLASGTTPTPAAVKHLDRCLSCLSCASTCAAGVEYRDVIDTAREYIENSGVRPLHQRAFRHVLARVLTTPSTLSTLMRVARPFAGLAAKLPGSLGALAQLSAAPALSALKLRSTTIEDGPIVHGRSGSVPAPVAIPAADAASPSTRRAAAPRLRRMALLSGCVQSVSGAEINAAARRVLERAGITVEATAATACCGALDLHMGHRRRAVEFAAARVVEWSAQLDNGGLEVIVVTTSGCGSVIAHYNELLEQRPDLASHVQRVMAATRDITQVLQTLALAPTGQARGAVVAYHDACSLKHGLKLTRPPRNVLRDAGYVVNDIAESHLCCGSAGTYNILQPAIAERLGRRKAAHASAGEPDVIAAGNLGCLVQMSRFTGVPVAHTVQLIDWATGGPPPRGLEHYAPPPELPNDTSAAPAAATPAAVAATEDSLW